VERRNPRAYARRLAKEKAPMRTTQTCPDPPRLHQLLDGGLPVDEQAELTRHLDTCAACRQTMERLAGPGNSWAGLARHLGEQAAPEPALRQVMEAMKGQSGGAATRAEPGGAESGLDFLEPSDRPGHLGRLGRYEILEVVGRGGFGIVFKALDEGLHRVVAIKVLAPELAASATARRRFTREAQAAAAVCHEHVVTIHAVDERHRPPYLVMHYVAGMSLQDKGGPLELREILRIGMQTAAGLAAAHAQGLVHRDVKPANILLENGVERVKLTDFGLARAADDASLTQSGVVAGTPMYMAPEQADGQPCDHRSDLFSLGSVLYTMCTGRPPFRASSAMAVLKRVIEDTPRPIRELNPDIPEWLCDIVAKLHAKRPAERFQSAQEVADLLGQHLAHLQQPHQVPLPPRVDVPASTRTKTLALLLEAVDTERRGLQHAGLLAGFGLLVSGLCFLLPPLSFVPVGAPMAVLGLVLAAAAAAVKQRWEVEHQGHRIRFENSCYTGEKLFIDGQLAARGGFGLRTELRGPVTDGAGGAEEIVVFCEATFFRVRCRIYVERNGEAARAEQPARLPQAKRRPMLPAASFVVLPAATLVVLLIWLAFYWLGPPVILWFTTGNVVVRANDPSVLVSLVQDGEEVAVLNTSSEQGIRLPPGAFDLKVHTPPGKVLQGLNIESKGFLAGPGYASRGNGRARFELSRGARVTITITVAPAATDGKRAP
jgi:serine/threonine-protein kinase